MEKEQVVSYLTDMFRSKEWFDHVGFDQYNRVVVYVHKMDSSVVNLIPEFTEDRKRIMVHFASSVRTDKNDVVNRPQSLSGVPIYRGANEVISPATFLQSVRAIQAQEIQIIDPEEEERALELRVQKLTDELDRLEKICGTNILADVFFECHDQKNAVTNLSDKFPEIRHRVQKLYDEYGFDVLYEQLEL